MLEVFRWQLGGRILNKPVIVPWVDDSKFISGIGDTGLTGNIYAGFMEYEDMLFLLHMLRPTETFVDVGANVGAYTILASKVVGAKSIPFEPLPATVEKLKDQVQINRIADLVSVRNKGVGEKTGELYFTDNNDTVNKVSLAGNVENTVSVEVIKLDDELERNIDYVFKIDVEGFEYQVIQGALDILGSKNALALIIELNGSGEEFGYSNEAIHRAIVDLNFHPVAYDPRNRKLKRLDSYNRNDGNTIYVKDFDLITKRCNSAPKRIVHTAGSVFI